MFVREFAYRPEFLGLVDDSAYMHVFGGMSQVIYAVCERSRKFSFENVLHYTDTLQEALLFSYEHVSDCRVYSCVVYRSGWVYVTDDSFAHASVCERPFEDVAFGRVFPDVRYVYDKASRIVENFAVTHNECVCFSLALVSSLAMDRCCPADTFGDVISFRDRFGVVEGFSDMSHDFGIQVFTEMHDGLDVSRVVHLLDESYVLAVELEAFSTYPFADGVGRLPTRHMCVLFRTEDGRYGLVDTEGVRRISVVDMERMCSFDCYVPDFVPWRDGCMIMGVRLGFGDVRMSYYDRTGLVNKALSVEEETAINVVTGDCVTTSDGDITRRRVGSDTLTIDVLGVGARRELFAFCSDNWDLLTKPDNYLHVKPHDVELDVDVCDFKGQPEASFHREKDITLIKTGSVSNADARSFGLDFFVSLRFLVRTVLVPFCTFRCRARAGSMVCRTSTS